MKLLHMCCYITGMVSASQQFFTLIESIGAKAANLPGSVRKLGKTSHNLIIKFHLITSAPTYDLR